MTWRWGFAAAVLLVSLVIQTERVYDRTEMLTAEGEVVRTLDLQVRTFKRAVMVEVARAAEDEQYLPRDGVYMIVDTHCGASAKAVQQIQRSGVTRKIRLASFVDSETDLRAWTSHLGVDIDVVHVPAESTFLRKAPRYVTPLFLEFSGGSLIDIHIGEMPPAWFE